MSFTSVLPEPDEVDFYSAEQIASFDQTQLRALNQFSKRNLPIPAEAYDYVTGFTPIDTCGPIIVVPEKGFHPEGMYLDYLFSKSSRDAIFKEKSVSNIFSLLRDREIGKLSYMLHEPGKSEFRNYVLYSMAWKCMECHDIADCECNEDDDRYYQTIDARWVRVRNRMNLVTECDISTLFEEPIDYIESSITADEIRIRRAYAPSCYEPVSRPPTVDTSYCPMCLRATCECYYSGDDSDITSSTPTPTRQRLRKAARGAMATERFKMHRRYLKDALNKARSPINHLDIQSCDSDVNRLEGVDPLNDYKFKLQARDVDPDREAFEFSKVLSYVNLHNAKEFAKAAKEQAKAKALTPEEIAIYLEDVTLLAVGLSEAKTKTQYIVAFLNYYKLRSGRSALFKLKEFISWTYELIPTSWWTDWDFHYGQPLNEDEDFDYSKLQLQGGDDDKLPMKNEDKDQIEDLLRLSRHIFEGFDSITSLPIYRKFHRFLTQCFAHSIFVGGDLEKFASLFMDIEAEAFKNTSKNKMCLAAAACDLLTFVAERGYQAIKLGTVAPLLHSASSYDEWYLNVQDIMEKAPYISNPEAHGFTTFSFLNKIDRLIEQGESILKLVKTGNKYEGKLIGSRLSSLKHIRNGILSKTAAMQNRKAPLAFLIDGTTSVGKSHFSYMMYVYYGKLCGLEVKDQFRYVRDSKDNYWVNFNSSQWCVHLDDIAPFTPSFGRTNGDPTLLEMLQVINNIPYVPIQADLDDKGKTPLLAELVLATTNTMHLNLSTYFQCPEAVARRFPWVISIKPKPEFATEDGRLDPTKIGGPIENNAFSDHWIITVRKVVLASVKESGEVKDSHVMNNVRYTKAHEFDNIYHFLRWYREIIKLYRAQQSDLKLSEDKIQKVVLCEHCDLPELGCICICSECEKKPEECTCPEMVRMSHMRLQGEDIPVDIVKIPYRSTVYEREVTRAQRAIKSMDYQKKHVLFSLLAHLLLLCLTGSIPFIGVIMIFLSTESIWRFVATYGSGRVIERRLLKAASSYAERRIGIPPRYAALAAAAAGALGTLVFGYKLIVGPRKEKEVERKTVVYVCGDDHKTTIHKEVECQTDFDFQSKDTEKPIVAHEEEKFNRWVVEDYQTTSFDITRTIASWKGLPQEQIVKEIFRNVVSIEILCKNPAADAFYKKKGNALCVAGNLYVTNCHLLPPTAEKVKLVQQNAPHQPNGNMLIALEKSRIMRFPDKDLAFFELLHIPPKKNITELFAKQSFRGNINGRILIRDETGSTVQKGFIRCSKVVDDPIMLPGDSLRGLKESVICCETWKAIAEPRTEDGDCGAPWLSFAPMGPVILGIHMAGHDLPNGVSGVSVSTCITNEFVKEICGKFTYTISETAPVLSTQSKDVELTTLHWKSPFRYWNTGNAFVYGSLKGWRAEPKSRVRPTPLEPVLRSYGWKPEHGAPVMRGWKPVQKAIEPVLHCANTMDHEILRRCKDAFVADILAKLTPEDLASLHPVDDFTAVNGAAGVAYVDPIKRSTSAGFPWKKSKKHFFEILHPMRGLDVPVEFIPEIMDRVRLIEERYDQGERWMPVFSDCLKDEPVSIKKIKEQKTRVFSGAPVDFAIMGRKYFLTLCRLMSNKRLVFELAVGTNTHSKDWTEIAEHLHYNDEEFADRFFDGDFGTFDKSMKAFIILLTFEAMIDICKASGNFDNIDIRRMTGYGVDTAYPLHDMFGDLVMLFGGNPSGHILTVFCNSFANSLYMRYVYLVNNPENRVDNFQDNVKLATYGDDNTGGVRKGYDWFNHTIIQDTLGKVGIIYTMADKDAESVPFKPFSEISFLKRKWVWDETLGRHLAPIEEKSLRKALMFHVESKTDSIEHQTISAVGNVMREYFMFGREKYEEMQEFLKTVVREAGLDPYVEDSTFRSWTTLKKDFEDEAKTPILMDSKSDPKGGVLLPPTLQ